MALALYFPLILHSRIHILRTSLFQEASGLELKIHNDDVVSNKMCRGHRRNKVYHVGWCVHQSFLSQWLLPLTL